MNDYIKQISDRIRELRDILDIDVEDISRQIGVTPDEYLAFETGAKEIPISLLYNQVAIELGISISNLSSQMENNYHTIFGA